MEPDLIEDLNGSNVSSGSSEELSMPETISMVREEEARLVRNPEETGKKRKVFLVRCGEQVDELDPSWTENCFLELVSHKEEIYVPTDLNQLPQLPPRPTQDHKDDPPLTEVGLLMSRLVGRGLGAKKYSSYLIYTSPALRALQTASSIRSSLPDPSAVKICVEPGLFGHLGSNMPKVVGKEEMEMLQIEVDESYKSVMSLEEVWQGREEEEEEVRKTYERLSNVVMGLVGQARSDVAAIITVTHCVGIDACMHALLGKSFPNVSVKEVKGIVPASYPHCCILGLKEKKDCPLSWSLLPPDTLLPLSFSGFSNRISEGYLNRNLKSPQQASHS